MAERTEVEITNRNRAAVHVIGRRFSAGVPRTLNLSEVHLEVVRGNPWLWITGEDWDGPGSDGDDIIDEETLTEEEETLDDLTVDQLKDILRERDLPVSGSKPELIARIQESDASSAEEESETEPESEEDETEEG